VSTLVGLDERLFVLLNQQWTSPFLDVVMPYLTDFDHWRIPVILILLVFLARGSTDVRLGILFAVLAVVVADQVASSGIKPLFERARPFDVVEGTRQLVSAHGYAFPSSHAANTFAAGTFLALRFRRWWPILLVSTAVAYSRVYVGVHWPSDAVAGAAIGAGIGTGMVAVERAARLRLERLFRRRRDGGGADPGADAG
jgi:undecaprenyl-diphosphatase